MVRHAGKIDLEIKIVVFVAGLLACKLLLDDQNALHVVGARCFFGLANLGFAAMILLATQRVESRPGAHQDKVSDRLALRACWKELAIRVVLVLALHFGVGMLQPLILSNVLGLMGVYENDVLMKMLR